MINRLYYLKDKLGLEKDVQKSQPEQSRQGAQQGSSKVQITAIRCEQSSSGKAGKNDPGQHKSIGNNSRIDHDRHFQKRAGAESREESKTQK